MRSNGPTILSFEGSREVKEELSRVPELTPARQRLLDLARRMTARRKVLELQEDNAGLEESR